jgi:hypothetical protein
MPDLVSFLMSTFIINEWRNLCANELSYMR